MIFGDGYLKIKTKLDSTELKKNIKTAEKELEGFKKETEKLNNKKLEIEAKLNLNDEEYKRKLDAIERKRQNELSVNTNEKGIIDTSKELKINNKYDNQIENLGLQMEKSIAKANYELEKIETSLESNKNKQSEWNSKIKEMNANLGKIESLDNLDNSVNKVRDSITKTIKNVGKWALAVFGVRSAYNAVRNAASTLSQYNEQIGADLEYIRFAMATALQPVIEKLISLVFTLLSYVNMIAKAWFGVDLFAKSSAKNFANANKKAEKTAKTLSQFNFDDINKLDDNSSSDNASGAAMPSVDLSGIDDRPVPSWLQWLIDNGDIARLIIEGIAAAIIALKFGLDSILGIFLIIEGVFNLIKDVKKLLDDPSWENFGKVLQDIGVIIAGFSLLFGNWKLGLVGLAVFVVGLVIEHWDEIMAIIGPIAGWVWNNVLQPIINFIGAGFDTICSLTRFLFSFIEGIFTTLISLLVNPFLVLADTVVGVFGGIRTTIEGVFNIIKGLFTGDWKLVMEGFKQVFKGTFDTLWSIAKAPLNLIIGGLNALIQGANKISFDVPNWVPVLGGKKFGFNIPTIKKLKTGGIVDLPGRGVPLASDVIAGEAGAEGVLPFDNPETMAKVGQEIGKWITLNIDLTSKIDMRVLCREIIKYMNENSFARNGGI